jgi:hypothetical protein
MSLAAPCFDDPTNHRIPADLTSCHPGEANSLTIRARERVAVPHLAGNAGELASSSRLLAPNSITSLSRVTANEHR